LLENVMIDLAGMWRLKDANNEFDLPVMIPGDIHSALAEQKVIPDPFFGTNEYAVQWVGARGWSVSRSFSWPVTGAGEGATRWLLEIDVVDTVAEIYLNGTLVGRSTSMFVPLRVDVSDALRRGENQIEVRFDSPESAAADRVRRLPYSVPHQIYPVQSMHRNLLRKAQCHSGWDWGIALMVSGIYGSVRLRPTGDAAIRSVRGVPRRSAADPRLWELPVVVEWDHPGLTPGDCDYPTDLPVLSAVLRDGSGTVVARSSSRASGNEPRGEENPMCLLRPGEAVLTLTVADPDLWWPAGYGEQPLYSVEVSLDGETRTFRTGFRTVKVINERDEIGASMFFRVNGRDVWAKGANWIPVDAFPSRQTPERYRELLAAARDANMNMIRVWGGGQYEPDLFYDICDEMGLLVWQDFMFSCSLYPSEEWFLGEVREEVIAQVSRLASHPAIAIWCGNNENVGALGWFDESLANPGRYLIDFDRLNNGVVGREVRRLDDTRVFWPSSPAAGEGDFSDNWHDDSSGDMHYWSVWHEGKPFSAYYEVTPRFCSEFGFQSFPSLATLRTFATEQQLNPTAPEMEHHQRHPRGNTVVVESIARYFRFPFDFEDFVYLSQVQQAMAIATAVTFWRSRRPVSMGALYWQLNDLWPVVSWSSIEYDGRWKLLHYEARRFFAAVRVAVFVRDGELEVHLFNDTDAEAIGSVLLQGLDWAGGELWRRELPVEAAPDAARAVWQSPVDDLPFGRLEGFVVATLAVSGTDANGTGTPLPENFREYTLLAEYKEVPLRRPAIDAIVEGDAVIVTCREAPAFWLQIELEEPARRLSDNGVFLLPGETIRIGLDRAPEDGRIHAVRTVAHVG
jgi:beta-mannosidase